MEEKLQLLLTYYENELSELNQLLKDAILETDFLAAHNFQQAVYKTQAQLNIFNNLSKNLYNEKDSILYKIAQIEKSLNSETTNFPTPHYDKILLQNKQQLIQQLHIAEQHADYNKNPAAFNETLNKLITRQIKKFNLTLDNRHNTHLIFSLKNKFTFKITIPIITTNYFTPVSEQVIRTLIKDGFSLRHNKTLVALLPNKSDKDIEALKTLVSKIVFETFAYNRYHESFITY